MAWRDSGGAVPRTRPTSHGRDDAAGRAQGEGHRRQSSVTAPSGVAHQDAKGSFMSTATKKTALLPTAGGRSARRARAVAEAEQVRAQEAAYRPQNGYLNW